MINFNPNNYEDVKDNNSLIPKGEYEAVIDKATWEQTKAGTGHYLKLEFVLTKEYANRRIWEIINLDNPNPQAVEIGNRTLATICRKLHIEMLTDYSQLLDTPIMLVVGIKKDDYYGDKNKVWNYGEVKFGNYAPPSNNSYSPPPPNNQQAPPQNNNDDFMDLNDNDSIIPF